MTAAKNKKALAKTSLVVFTFLLTVFFCCFPVKSKANEGAAFSDHPRDVDGDGLIDSLVIEVNATIDSAGEYGVEALLTNQTGETIGLLFMEKKLAAGRQEINLRFNGTKIYSSHYSGNYLLKKLVLTNANGRQVLSLADAYHTSTYNYSEFERPDIYINGTIKEYGTDENGNNLYDYLNITVPIKVERRGSYIFKGIIKSINNSLAAYTNLSLCKRGKHYVNLSFSGEQISLLTSSTLVFKSLTVYYENINNPLIQENAFHKIQYFAPSDFDIPPTKILYSRLTDYGKYINSDKLLDSLVINTTINIHEKGNFNLVGRLYDHNHNLISSTNLKISLAPRVQTIKLSFPGHHIREHRVSGFFEANIRLYPEDSNEVLAQTTYITDYYNYTNFKESNIRIKRVDRDFGADISGNGLYDYLSIQVSLDNKNQAKYTMEAYLFDEKDNAITMAVNTFTAEDGGVNVTLNFFGNKIREYYEEYLSANSYNQSFHIKYISIYDSDGNKVLTQDTTYETSKYEIHSFSPNPPPISGNKNGNIQWNYLVVAAITLLIILLLGYFKGGKIISAVKKRKKHTKPKIIEKTKYSGRHMSCIICFCLHHQEKASYFGGKLRLSL